MQKWWTLSEVQLNEVDAVWQKAVSCKAISTMGTNEVSGGNEKKSQRIVQNGDRTSSSLMSFCHTITRSAVIFFFAVSDCACPHSNHPNLSPTTTTTITHAPPLLPPSSPVGKNTAAKVKTKLGKPEKCLHKRLSDNFSISGFHGNQYGYVCQGTSCARLKQLVRSS